MSRLEDAFRSLFETNMGVKKGESVLVFSDAIRQDETPSPADADRRARLHQAAGEAARFASAVYGNAFFISYPATAAPGAEPPEVLWKAALGESVVDRLAKAGILQDLIAKSASGEQLAMAEEIVLAGRESAADVIIAMANNSTSHTRFRALANAAGARFASLPNFDPDMFFTSMLVDWRLLAERTERLADAVNNAVAIAVECPNGTRMRFYKRGREAKGDNGLLTEPGSFGNLPAGEVYLAPLEGTSEGVMVIEYAPTRKLESPLELSVRDGRVVEIRGDEPYRLKLEQKFAESEKNRNIAELGIGTNDRATRPDNILEAEKILGTIHIALGDNTGFGGTVSTPFHEDYVFYKPTLTAIMEDGSERILLDGGKLMI
jgi:leucyl aminopeptidase (aminopeptidase T)